MSAVYFAKIHKLVFEVTCLQNWITHKHTHTDRRSRVYNQPHDWRLTMIALEAFAFDTDIAAT